MLTSSLIWLASFLAISFFTRTRDKAPLHAEHPVILRTQSAYAPSHAATPDEE